MPDHFRVARLASHCNLLEMSDATQRFPSAPLSGFFAVPLIFLVLAACGAVMGHQVPSLTVDALFFADRSYTLRINLDPRLFISDQPSSLPPVPVEWYRDQKEDELAATLEKAAGYLRKALRIQFGDVTWPVDHCEFRPMDGATNMPLSADTKELHLLAEAKGTVPEGKNSFALSLSHDANVSMILLSSFEGTMERRPNVVFPGETSRSFMLAYPARPVNPPAVRATNKPEPVSESGTRSRVTPWLAVLAGILLAFMAVLWRSKKS